MFGDQVSLLLALALFSGCLSFPRSGLGSQLFRVCVGATDQGSPGSLTTEMNKDINLVPVTSLPISYNDFISLVITFSEQITFG